MKKILLLAAIAALSQQAAAVSYNISSDIPDVGGTQFWLNNNEGALMEVESEASGFSITGTINDSDNNGVPDGDAGGIDIAMDGQVVLTITPQLKVTVTFDMTSDQYVVDRGIIWNGGSLLIELNTEGVISKLPQSRDDLSDDELNFLAGLDGFAENCPGQCTAGILLQGFAGDAHSATRTLPGFYSGAGESDDGWDNGVGTIDILAFTGGLFLDGTVTRAPVPVPAAAWLFGSALLGLAGVGRRKK